MRIAAELVRLRLIHRLHALRNPLLVDLVPADAIQRDRVGGEIDLPVLPNKLRPAARAAVVQPLGAIENMEYRFIADRGGGHNRRNESPTNVERRSGVTAV